MIPHTRHIVLIAVIAALLIVAAPSLNLSQDANGETGQPSESMLLDIRLEGDATILGTEQEADFQLRISYSYPERILRYNYRAEIAGENMLGASVSPDNGTSEDGIFFLKIKGPTNAGELKVKVNASANETDTSWYQIKEFVFKVVKPIHISAVLHNSGENDANNVTVQMFVDGVLKDLKTYNISAGSSVTVHFNWTFGEIPGGEYKVTLVADSSDNIVEFSEGDNTLEMTIYYTKSGNPLRGVISVMIIFVVIVLILTILQKKSVGKKP